jgi:hypothetical protein
MPTPAWHVDGADEVRHAPDPDDLWNESYYLDVVDESGTVGGYVRLGLYPNLSVAWWTTCLVIAGEETVLSVAYDLDVPVGDSLVATGPGTSIEIDVVRPLAEMRVVATAPAARFTDATEVYVGSGVPTELALDLTWTTDGEPYHYGVATRYEIPCTVAGTMAVDGTTYTLVGPGQRDHSWGVRDWWAFGWCWLAARLDDGTRLHAADIRIPGMPMLFGYVQADGVTTSLDRLEVSEELGAEGLPTRGTASLGPSGIDVRIEPLGFGPLVLVADDGRTSRFPRAMARFVAADGRPGLGWIEWNQPQGLS